MKFRNLSQAVDALTRGGIGVMPTDTIYGIVASAFDPKVVARIYGLRRRNFKKPMVILIGSLGDLKLFGIRLDMKTRRVIKKWWPGKVSVVLKAAGNKRCAAGKRFKYLHRGTGTLAFRMPKPAWLRKFLRKTGPLVAPSANLEGEPPAKTVREARKYFGGKADFYLDGGTLVSEPSTLVRIEKGKAVVLREGAARVRP
jgi:L-threonylcarbamoyladenylate synthase